MSVHDDILIFTVNFITIIDKWPTKNIVFLVESMIQVKTIIVRFNDWAVDIGTVDLQETNHFVVLFFQFIKIDN